jgi:hypothetical protein
MDSMSGTFIPLWRLVFERLEDSDSFCQARCCSLTNSRRLAGNNEEEEFGQCFESLYLNQSQASDMLSFDSTHEIKQDRDLSLGEGEVNVTKGTNASMRRALQVRTPPAHTIH